MDTNGDQNGAKPDDTSMDQFDYPELEVDFDQLGIFPYNAVDFGELLEAEHDQDGLAAASPASSASGGALLFNENEDEDDAFKPPSSGTTKPGAELPTKIGNRFTSGAVKVLRNWFNKHEKHPYPTPEQIERLRDQTGLEKQQITNWFANTRRRRKFRLYASTSMSPDLPSVTKSTMSGNQGSTDIPARRPTPMPLELMNPLQRWEHSPPEHEPALVSDISRALADSSSRGRPRSLGLSSGNASSMSSAPTSRSASESQSNNSAYSHGSRRSNGSQESIKIASRRRRRGVGNAHKGRRTDLRHVRNTYQCTFCTETFKTKYDWQRHEKSLHLSLEEWICSPHGSTERTQEKGPVCVYCDEPNPDQPHLDAHNQAACSERPVEERTFYRKDHLKQHLKLVHGIKQMTVLMEKWKLVTGNVRSRCGFCDTEMETWAERGDHLADHFKNGSTMMDWEGDWGFEPSVLEMLDKAMPPYLLRLEQYGPVPYSAVVGPADTSPSAYELLKLEMEYYVRNYFESNQRLPSDDELKYVGCSIIFGAEFFSPVQAPSAPSWLRDLFMCSPEITTRARFRSMKQFVKMCMTQLHVKGKMNIFEGCDFESQLCRHIGLHTTLGLEIADQEIQQEACAILGRLESCSTNPSNRFSGFLVRLIWESADWIAPLRQRGMQYQLENFVEEAPWGEGEPSLLNPQNQLDQFYGQLADFGQMSCAAKEPPYNPNNSLGRVGLPNAAIVEAPLSANAVPIAGNTTMANPSGVSRDLYLRLQTSKTLFHGSGLSLQGGERPRGNGMPFLLNDNNRYLHLARELARFVASTMSPSNPNSHIPSDEEIRYQARWILYDDDDPWNQTPADLVEWMAQFKKDVGLL